MTPVATRFWAKVDQRGPSECWPWVASRDPDGYGRLKVDGVARKAHVVSLELAGRTITAGMEVDHLCRNRRCVNPAHLDIVTHRENGLRGTGPVAINARKALCPKGHALAGDNLVKNEFRVGRRRCRICQNAQQRERQARKRAVAA